MRVLYVVLGVLFILSSCDSNKYRSPLEDFDKPIALEVIDSIDLERLDILNPHTILYKDSFLIFSTIQGKKEMQFLDLRTMAVYTCNVIGQGANEMSMYSIVKNPTSRFFRFADYRKGRIYEVDLEKLRADSAVQYTMAYELPLGKDELVLRFFETENNIYGIGLLQKGRIYSFNKKKSLVKQCANYPTNEDIEKLDMRHKGALFTRTLMAGNANHLVTASFGLIDFYEVLPDDSLQLKQMRHYFFPKFTSREYGIAISFDTNDIHGFSGIDSDERFVYLLYSRKNFKESGEDICNSSDLFLYDWHGNPFGYYSLSKPLYGFSLFGNKLYGLSRVGNPKVYIYSLRI